MAEPQDPPVDFGRGGPDGGLHVAVGAVLVVGQAGDAQSVARQLEWTGGKEIGPCAVQDAGEETELKNYVVAGGGLWGALS